MVDPKKKKQFPGYELKKKLGGANDVYVATETKMDRDIVLKTPRNQSGNSEIAREGRIIADLEHPNIVPVFNVGSIGEGADERAFYAMKFVDGEEWSKILRRNRNLKDEARLREHLAILRKVCDALGFAQEKGILNIDLKPLNIMVGKHGEVQLMDWGVVTSEDASVENWKAGTPAYMAPEHALGNFKEKIDERTVVYLLGAILFEILTGEPPHDVAECSVREAFVVAAKNKIRGYDPDTGVSPSLLNEVASTSLLEIALKSLATAPPERYQSISEFAKAVDDSAKHQQSLRIVDEVQAFWDDSTASRSVKSRLMRGAMLGPYLDAIGKLKGAIAIWGGNERAANLLTEISAHLESTGKRAAWVKWLLVILAVVSSLSGGFLLSQNKLIGNLSRNKRELDEQVGQLKTEKSHLTTQTADLRRESSQLKTERKVLTTEKENLTKEKKGLTENLETLEKTKAKLLSQNDKANEEKAVAEYHAMLMNVGTLVTQRSFDPAKALLSDRVGKYERFSENLEYRLLKSLCHRRTASYTLTDEESPIEGNASDPSTREETIALDALAMSSFGLKVAGASKSIWTINAGKVERQRAIDSNQRPIVFSLLPLHGGKELIVGISDSDGFLRKLTQSGRQRVPNFHTNSVVGLDADPSGEFVLSASYDGTARLWRASDMQQIAILGRARGQQVGHDGPVSFALFTPRYQANGDFEVITGGHDGALLRWNFRGSHRMMPDNVTILKTIKNAIYAGVISDRGEIAIGTDNGQIHVVDSSGKAKKTIAVHKGAVRCLDYLRLDDKHTLLASGGDDNVVHVLENHNVEWTFRGHSAPVTDLVLDQANNDLMVHSSSHDGTVKTWSLQHPEVERTIDRFGGVPQVVLYSDDGSHVMVAGANLHQRIMLYNISDFAKPTEELEEGHKYLSAMADTLGDSQLGFNALVSSGIDNSVRVWDRHTAGQIASQVSTGRSAVFAISSDKRLVATGSDKSLRTQDGDVWGAKIFSVHLTGKTLKLKHQLPSRHAEVTAIAFSRDGSRVITGDSRGRCRCWATRDGRQVWGSEFHHRAHSNRISDIRFVSTSEFLVASRDRTVTRWNLQTGRASPNRWEHPKAVTSLDVEPNRQYAVTSCADGKLRVWNLPQMNQHASWPPNHRANDSSETAKNQAPVPIKARFKNRVSQPTILVSMRSGELREFVLDHRKNLVPQSRAIAGSRAQFAGLTKGDEVMLAEGRKIRLLRPNSTREEVYTAQDSVVAACCQGRGEFEMIATVDSVGHTKVWKRIDREWQVIKSINATDSSAKSVDVYFSSSDAELMVAGEDQSQSRGFVRFYPLSGRNSKKPEIPFFKSPVVGAVIRDGELLVACQNGEICRGPRDAWTTEKRSISLGAKITGMTVWPKTGRVSLLALSCDNSIRLVRIDDWHQSTFPKGTGHTKPINCMAFTADGKRLISGSEDATLRIWDTVTKEKQRNLRELVSLVHPSPITSLAIRHDDSAVLVGDRSKQVIQWELIPSSIKP